MAYSVSSQYKIIWGERGGGGGGRDHMVVGIITICAIGAYHYKCC